MNERVYITRCRGGAPKVYHTRQDCPRLRKNNPKWTVRLAYAQHGHANPCQSCQEANQ